MGILKFFLFSPLPIIDSLNSERLLEIEKDVRIWFQVIIQYTSIRYSDERNAIIEIQVLYTVWQEWAECWSIITINSKT